MKKLILGLLIVPLFLSAQQTNTSLPLEEMVLSENLDDLNTNEFKTLLESFSNDDLLNLSSNLQESAVQGAPVMIENCGPYTSPSGNYVWESTGLYRDTIIEEDGSETILKILLIVRPLPTVVAEGTSEINFGETIELQEAGGDADEWQWTGPNSFSSQSQNPNITNASISESGMYVVTGTRSNFGCSSKDSVYVNVNISIPTTKLIEKQCGTVLSNPNTWITCDEVANAEDYEFLFENSDIGFSNSRTTSSVWGTEYGHINYMRLYYIPELMHGVVYDVRVRAKVNGIWGEYGTACDYNLIIRSTRLEDAQCGHTFYSKNDLIFAIPVTGVENYDFHVSNSELGMDVIINTEDIWGAQDARRRYFRLYKIPNIEYGYTYNIEVRANADGSHGNWGNTCQISLEVPTTTLTDELCNSSLTSINDLIFAKNVNGAEDYEFSLTNDVLGYYQTIKTSDVWGDELASRNYMRLSYIPGVENNNTLGVQVRVKVNGIWGAYGDLCELTIGENENRALDFNFENQKVDIKYSPNPFNSSITLSISQDSELSAYNANIFNISGQLVEEKALYSNNEYNLGASLNPGIYYLVISDTKGFKESIKIIKTE